MSRYSEGPVVVVHMTEVQAELIGKALSHIGEPEVFTDEEMDEIEELAGCASDSKARDGVINNWNL